MATLKCVCGNRIFFIDQLENNCIKCVCDKCKNIFFLNSILEWRFESKKD